MADGRLCVGAGFASLFVERFYCRFACPLGAGLAIFGKVRIFNSLKRHPECGSRCHSCETICPVGAIKHNGQINMNECFFCLDCQVAYYDDHVCPPMAWRRGTVFVMAGGRPHRDNKPMRRGSLGAGGLSPSWGHSRASPCCATDRRATDPAVLYQWTGTALGFALARVLLYHPMRMQVPACHGALHSRNRATGADFRVMDDSRLRG